MVKNQKQKQKNIDKKISFLDITISSPLLLLSQPVFFPYWIALNTVKLYYIILLVVGRAFANGPGDWNLITGQVISKNQKWYLIPPCLTLSIIRYISRVKWSNPGKGVAPASPPWCSSYWKGSLRVALDYSCQLYFYRYYIILKTPGSFFFVDLGHVNLLPSEQPKIF